MDDVGAPYHGPADEGDDPGVLEVPVELDLALRGDLVLGRVARNALDHVLGPRARILHQVDVAEPTVSEKFETVKTKDFVGPNLFFAPLGQVFQDPV